MTYELLFEKRRSRVAGSASKRGRWCALELYGHALEQFKRMQLRPVGVSTVDGRKLSMRSNEQVEVEVEVDAE